MDTPQTGGLPRFPAMRFQLLRRQFSGNPLAVPGLPNAIPYHFSRLPQKRLSTHDERRDPMP
jgi:hypothetical protein